MSITASIFKFLRTKVTVQTPSQQTVQLSRTTDGPLDHFIQSSPPQEMGSERLRIRNQELVTVLEYKRNSDCHRDQELEERARKLLQPYSPELAARVVVGWNRRLRTTAGRASYQRWEVVLHPALKEISEAEVDKTLRHELAHLLARDRSGRRRIAPHGAEWRQACVDLGIPNEGRTHQLPFVRHRQRRKFFYRCPGCQETLGRVKKPRREIACLRCCRLHAGGRYDKRFRYELVTASLHFSEIK